MSKIRFVAATVAGALIASAMTVVIAAPAQAAGPTTLVNETFTGATVSDPRFIGTGDACLTKAPRPSSPLPTQSNLSYCKKTAGPSPSVANDGWLQLTDASNNSTGSAVYDQAIPSKYGIQVEFQQAQYNSRTDVPADGIGFFLTGGAFSLDNVSDLGANGGSLGYAQKASGSQKHLGVDGGVIGVGLDYFGNFRNTTDGRGTGCVAPENPGFADSVVERNYISLRGPAGKLLNATTGERAAADRANGYCLLDTQKASSIRAERTAPHTVRVTVAPTDANGTALVTVQMQYGSAGAFTTVLSSTVKNLPATYKFGFSGSTGDYNDVHLVRLLKVQSVNELPNLALAKEVDPESASFKPAGQYQAGDKVPYTFTVTNGRTDGLPLANVRVNDNRFTAAENAAIICSLPNGNTVANNGLLTLTGLGSPGSSVTCRGTHTLTAADVAAGVANNNVWVNTATATALGVDPVTDSAEVTVLDPPRTGITLDKTNAAPVDTNGNGQVDAGDRIQYSFAVSNQGNVPLTGVVVNDPKLGITNLAVGTLAAGASKTVAATGLYTITEADVIAGSVINTATSTGKVPAGSGLTDPTAADVNRVPTAAAATGIALDKTNAAPVDTNGNGQVDAGDTIQYSFKVTNSGNVSLSNVVVNDSKLGISNLSVGTLTPGQSKTVDAATKYTITEDDVVAGSVVNSATSTGKVPAGSGLTDPTAGDVNRVPTAVKATKLDLDKTNATPVDVNGNGKVDAGDTIQYSFKVTNSGNVSLGNVVVNDSKLGISNLSVGTLTPGQSKTIQAPSVYTVTEADVINKSVDNTATSKGTVPAGSGLTDPTATDTNKVSTDTPTSGITLDKTNAAPVDSNSNNQIDAGDKIQYSFKVTNSGNVTLTNVVVNDPKLGITNLAVGTLTPGQTRTVQAAALYTITEDDVVAGTVVNTATSTGKVPANSGLTDPTAADVNRQPTAKATSALTLDKTNATPVDVNGNKQVDAGDKIQYSFKVTNSGNVTLSNVVVNDSKLGISNLSVGTLAPGESKTVAAPSAYTVTEGDVIDGTVINTATSTGKVPANSGLTDPTAADINRVPTATKATKLELDKVSASPVDVNGTKQVDAGDTIQYSFKVTNSGNVTLSNVVVNDSKLGISNLSVGTLAPGESKTVQAPNAYKITEADVVNTSVDNTATSTGKVPAGSGLTDPTATDTNKVPTAAAATKLDLDKVSATPVDVNGTKQVDAGDTIQYSFKVTNGGNVTLSNVVVNDSKLGISNLSVGTLAPGESKTVQAPAAYKITEADVVRGSIENTATSTGKVPAGSGLTDPSATDTDKVTTATAASGISIVKIASEPQDVDKNGDIDAGDRIRYSFEVTNTGNVTLNEVVVNDAKLGITKLAVGTLAPGQTKTVDAPNPYVITEGDVTAGKVVNTADTTGKVPTGSGLPDPKAEDESTVPTASAKTSLQIVKRNATPVDTNDNGQVDAGDKVSYSFEVKNSGNVTLTNVVVNDEKLGLVNLAVGTLTPGQTKTVDAPSAYAVTEGDVVKGSVDNTAKTTGTTPPGSGLTNPTAQDDNSVTTAKATTGITLDKTNATPDDVNGNKQVDAGDTIGYSFKVTNPGNITLKDVVVNDAKLGIENLSVGTLNPGETKTVDAPEKYTVTEADVIGGTVVNSATTTGKVPADSGLTDPTAGDINRVPTAAVSSQLKLDKSSADAVDVNDNKQVDAGDTIAYSFTVTNSGNVTLKDVVVNDAKLGLKDLAVGTLAPGESKTVEAPKKYTITESDVINGSVDNTATSTGKVPADSGLTDPKATDTDQVPTAKAVSTLKLDKSSADAVDVNDNDQVDAGDTVQYSFKVTNTGNVTLNDVVVNDAKLGLKDLSVGTLAPGESATVTAPEKYTITEADVVNGSVENTATSTGKVPADSGLTDPKDTDTDQVTTATAASGISIVKIASEPKDVDDNGDIDAGDEIDYSFEVTNTGNVTLTDVVVNDKLLGLINLTVGTLAPDQTKTVKAPAAYKITEKDLSAGKVVNTADTTGQVPPSSGLDNPTAEDESTVPTASAKTGLQVVKRSGVPEDTNDNGQIDAGDKISYSFEIKNTGNVTLTDVVVNDKKLDLVDLVVGTLTPGQSRTVDAPEKYTVTEADLVKGSVDNRAIASGKVPADSGLSDPEGQDDNTVPTAPASTGMTLDKRNKEVDDVNDNGVTDTGDKIVYTFEVTNTGNVTLNDVVVNDAKLGLKDLAVGTLAPGESKKVEAPSAYEVTEKDVVKGEVLNAATSTGKVPADSGLQDPSAKDENTVPTVPAASAIQIQKSVGEIEDVNDNGVNDAGDKVSYTFEVTNTGNLSLTDVVIDDAKLGVSGLAVGDLAPNDVKKIVAPKVYTLTEDDAFKGEFVNTATVTGEASDGSTPKDESTATVNPSADPSLRVDKSDGDVEDVNGNGVNDTGDKIRYTFKVTNTGNVTLKDVVVDDKKLGISNLSVGTLAPGEDKTVKAPSAYVITERDLINGSVSNTATSTGTPAQGDPVKDEDTVTTPTDEASPKIQIVKTADSDNVEDTNDNGILDAGDTVPYLFTVTNNGNLTLTDVVVDDPKLKVSGLSVGTLAPGDSKTVKGPDAYVITEDDAFAGLFENTATATGQDPDGKEQSDDSTEIVNPSANPSIQVEKSDGDVEDVNDNGITDTGDKITYTFEVTNTGNVKLDGVVVDDKKLGIADLAVGQLAPGESRTVSAPSAYVVTEDDVVAGKIVNSATTTGNPGQGEPVGDDDTVTTDTEARTGLQVVKSSSLDDTDGDERGDTGEQITYTFKVTNTGNVTLTGVVLDDPKLGLTGSDRLTVGTLEPGQTREVTADKKYTVTEQDTIAGDVLNIVTVTGNPPTDLDVPDPSGQDDDKVPTEPALATIDLVKTQELQDDNGNGRADKGEKIQYGFEVTNTGNVTLPDVLIEDPKLGLSQLSLGAPLAPGQSAKVAAPQVYEVTDQDIVDGIVRNVATATAETPPSYNGEPPTDTDTVEVSTPDEVVPGGVDPTDPDKDKDNGKNPVSQVVNTVTGVLPNTGGPRVLGLAALGLLLLGAGVWVLRRRRSESDLS